MTEKQKWEAVSKIASLSKDSRKVGCCLFPVKKKKTHYYAAYNQTPLGLDTRDMFANTSNAVVHAEVGALAFSDDEKYDLYCTYAPCLNCASTIILSKKVKSVHYEKILNDHIEGIALLLEAKIPVFKRVDNG